jgi:N-acetylglucosamine repressor
MHKILNMNNETMKRFNASTVFNVIRENEPISRKDIARITGLTSSSITNIVNRFMEKGYLEETGLGTSCGGRKPIMLQLKANAFYVIGVELTTGYIMGIMTNLKAVKIYKDTVSINRKAGRQKIIDEMIALIDRLIKNTGVPKNKIIGIGIAAPGPYDHVEGILVNPPNFPGWINVPIKSIIEKAFSIPVFLEKETVAAALGEYWFGGAKDARSLFVINSMKVGLGGGMLIDGKIYHGFKDGAGDVGHMTIDIDGPQCTCGGFGCLEALASGLYMVSKAVSEIKRGAVTLLNDMISSIDEITVDHIIKGAEQRDGLCMEIIEKTARYLGIGLINIINIYSPDMIIIGGDLTIACPAYVEKAVMFARQHKYPRHNKDVKILPTSFGEEMACLGAISVVLQDFFNLEK